MEDFLAERPNSTKQATSSDKIDLTLKLSPCGENVEEKLLTLTRSSSSIAEEIEKARSSVGNGPQVGPFVASLARSWSVPTEAGMGVMRFGELQTMRRIKTGKRLLLEKQRRAAAAAETEKMRVASGNSRHEDEARRDSACEGGVSSKMQTSPKQENDSMVSPKTIVKELIPAKKAKLANPCVKGDDAMDILLRQMPSVTTTGDGPNGKRIEGLLYKYGRGQVCIVCVCHGSFMSPAEFVMHAGGKEMANPMKHITVCSNSF